MRAASDVGGTFTDLVYYDYDEKTGKSGPVKIAKADTTPPNFEQGVMNAIHKMDLNPEDMTFFAHGSTVIINALTERKGVKTALITTRGFRDVLEIARGNRPDLFNFNFRKPVPFVDRYLRLELDERVNYKGEIERPVELSPLQAQLEYLKSEGVEAIAISFLHAYVNPDNENIVVREIKKLWPEVSVLASSEISREWREYERTNTTVLSAYVHPIAKKYIESLERKLASEGFTGHPYMMQSNGGIATVESAKNNPITMVESGPASGIFAAAYLGKMIDEKNLVVLDIGGTTAKCALIEEGDVKVTTEYYIEKDTKSPGYPIQTPVSEIVEIGNGGGSIAWTDKGGKLHVGPQSAGAMPGPAAYGKGGTKPTTTDSNLILGRIDKNCFVGGEVEPDMDAVHQAFAQIMTDLDVSLEEAARGVVRIANANMTNALRLVSTNKGYDPRDFALIAFGGGGAMHAVALAEELKVPKVIVPVNSSVFSAWGMLLTDLRRDYIQTHLTMVADQNAAEIAEVFQSLKNKAAIDYNQDGVEQDQQIIFEHLADLRYAGQEHTVKVSIPVNDQGQVDIIQAIASFHDAYEKRYTYRLDAAVQLVNFHLIAKVEVPKPEIVKKQVTGRSLSETILHERHVDFDQHGVHNTVVYDGLKLEPGMVFTGPAIIQEPSATLVISPGHTANVDVYGNYIIHLNFAEKGA
ncbi:hydantoinase/oxoprolinase family protein [Paremcibacter congregatus]|uniref:hydantoinase/oxoprolinase family protein n=1 Tax=Paremcibacter congregatus TaxID=2043170 RepID=UPI0030ECD51F|tara:strand:- start:7678 stop:9759 length:2082 start_codon:yes stop_codon:yes gene_type:complete